MTKQDYIQYWITTAKEDSETMSFLFKGKRYVHALFFGHLHIEKICKALWVKNNKENIPPKIHNLLSLLEQAKVKPDEKQLLFMLKLNQYQIEGRYPDDQARLKKITSKELTQQYISEIKKLSSCLLKELQ